MAPMTSCPSSPWVHGCLKLIRFEKKKKRNNDVKQSCFFFLVSGSGAAAAVSIFEDRFKANMEVGLVVFVPTLNSLMSKINPFSN